MAQINRLEEFRLKRELDEEIALWRPVVNGILTYTEACMMHPRDLAKANLLVDRMIKEQKQSMKGKSGKG
ncbi:hypothetical protein EHO61_11315 [Leptospira fluminis]|uniref:Uncharacterized protein n=1 Tax=Leptospira fluminis TaxID=2484979 RepID=A0A4R9GNK1_9LEPT|nr:hypothetical protein [Leptospira fluminis]TGK18039.1 hypothetical protein EHO61_11315 [Leptospira fluminis]